MTKSILLIVEGPADETKFIRKLFSVCRNSIKYKVYPYRTTIHTLAQEIYNNYNDFDKGNIDLQLLLSSLESDKDKKKMLKSVYSDIYMIFDFEPQHDHPHFDTIRRMIVYFNDSTNKGKLFINYPMMQTYKHFTQLPCPYFENVEISIKDIDNYKYIVHTISNYKDLTKYDYNLFISIAIHHLKKANKIINNIYEIPDADSYLQFDYTRIYDFQIDLMKTKQVVSVLNTSIFILFDFNPQKTFASIIHKKGNLSI